MRRAAATIVLSGLASACAEPEPPALSVWSDLPEATHGVAVPAERFLSVDPLDPCDAARWTWNVVEVHPDGLTFRGAVQDAEAIRRDLEASLSTTKAAGCPVHPDGPAVAVVADAPVPAEDVVRLLDALEGLDPRLVVDDPAADGAWTARDGVRDVTVSFTASGYRVSAWPRGGEEEVGNGASEAAVREAIGGAGAGVVLRSGGALADVVRAHDLLLDGGAAWVGWEEGRPGLVPVAGYGRREVAFAAGQTVSTLPIAPATPEVEAAERSILESYECSAAAAVAARGSIPLADWPTRWNDVAEPRGRTRTRLDHVVAWEGGLAGLITCRAAESTGRQLVQELFVTDPDGRATWTRVVGFAEGRAHVVWGRASLDVVTGEGLPRLLVLRGAYEQAFYASVGEGRAAMWVAPGFAEAAEEAPRCAPLWRIANDHLLLMEDGRFQGEAWRAEARPETGAIVVVGSAPEPVSTRARWTDQGFTGDCHEAR